MRFHLDCNSIRFSSSLDMLSRSYASIDITVSYRWYCGKWPRISSISYMLLLIRCANRHFWFLFENLSISRNRLKWTHWNGTFAHVIPFQVTYILQQLPQSPKSRSSFDYRCVPNNVPLSNLSKQCYLPNTLFTQFNSIAFASHLPNNQFRWNIAFIMSSRNVKIKCQRHSEPQTNYQLERREENNNTDSSTSIHVN